nr:deaminase domain-containing protein [Ralstonia solanacearum]
MAAPFGVRGSTAAADANTAAATGRAADAARASETPTWTANGGAYSQSSAGAGTPVTTVRAGPGYSAADVVPGRVVEETANAAPESGFARYLNNSTNPEIRTALADQVAGLRSALPADLQGKGNLAFAQIDVPGIPNTMKAFSRFDSGEFGYTPTSNGPSVFSPLSVDKYGRVDTAGAFLRNVDGEYKILDGIAKTLGENPSVTGRIDLFTELKACTSCAGTVAQFRARYPGIQLNVFTGK